MPTVSAVLPRAAASSPAPARASFGEAFRAALDALSRAGHRVDEGVAAARRHRAAPDELLALQAEAYRFSETVELAARVVEQGTQAVRQAAGAQV